VALLATRDGIPFDDALPSLDMFDHAIVYLPERDEWIDATSPWSAAGELPWMDQDRPALLIHPTEGRLVRTPEQPATYQVVTRAEAREPGRATLSETTDAQGWPAIRLLGSLGSLSGTDRQEVLANYARERYGAEAVDVDLSERPGPAKLVLAAPGVGAVTANTTSGLAQLDLSSIGEQLSPAMLQEVEHRTAPLDGLPAVHRAVVQVRMPPGYTIDELPSAEEWTVGDATLR